MFVTNDNAHLYQTRRRGDIYIKVPLHNTIRACGALRLPCTPANRNVRHVSRMFRADENRMTWH